MNNIRSTAAINAKELELGTKGSWHDEFKHSAYIFIGGLDPGLTEGDIITIFSQYGEPVHVTLPRDKSTSKPRGFGFLMYDDQRSTNLAVDNLNGAIVVGRTLRVDHVKDYKHLEKGEDGKMRERDADKGELMNALPELHVPGAGSGSDDSDAESYGSIDPEDPMASYLLEQRKANKKSGGSKDKKKKRKHEGETKEERKARKDAKKLKKLLKEVGPSLKGKGKERNDRDGGSDRRRDDTDRERLPERRRDGDREGDRARVSDRRRDGDRDSYRREDRGSEDRYRDSGRDRGSKYDDRDRSREHDQERHRGRDDDRRR